MANLVNVLRVLLLQALITMRIVKGETIITLGTKEQVEVPLLVSGSSWKKFTFRLGLTPKQIVEKLHGDSMEYVLSMCRAETAIWLQDRFLLKPPNFSVTKPENETIQATLI